MKEITSFAKQPELVEVVLDSEEIQNEYGDKVVFYMKDFVDINTYFEFFKTQAEDPSKISTLLNKIILNKDGKPALQEDQVLPASLAIAAIIRINEILGKSKTKPLTNQVGDQPA